LKSDLVNGVGLPRDMNFKLLPISKTNLVAFYVIELKSGTAGCTGMELIMLDLSQPEYETLFLIPMGWISDQNSNATSLIFA
jgi:hypothetical protein